MPFAINAFTSAMNTVFIRFSKSRCAPSTRLLQFRRRLASQAACLAARYVLRASAPSHGRPIYRSEIVVHFSLNWIFRARALIFCDPLEAAPWKQCQTSSGYFQVYAVFLEAPFLTFSVPDLFPAGRYYDLHPRIYRKITEGDDLTRVFICNLSSRIINTGSCSQDWTENNAVCSRCTSLSELVA